MFQDAQIPANEIAISSLESGVKCMAYGGRAVWAAQAEKAFQPKPDLDAPLLSMLRSS